jgi:hypothetical protein
MFSLIATGSIMPAFVATAKWKHEEANRMAAIIDCRSVKGRCVDLCRVWVRGGDSAPRVQRGYSQPVRTRRSRVVWNIEARDFTAGHRPEMRAQLNPIARSQ